MIGAETWRLEQLLGVNCSCVTAPSVPCGLHSLRGIQESIEEALRRMREEISVDLDSVSDKDLAREVHERDLPVKDLLGDTDPDIVLAALRVEDVLDFLSRNHLRKAADFFTSPDDE